MLELAHQNLYVEKQLNEVEGPVPSRIPGSKIVLLIEDNPDDERLTLRVLRKNNIMNEVIVAYDGQEALDYLDSAGRFSDTEREIHPSLVILDLKLPKVSGLQVLERIRGSQETRHLPVVILTSSDEPADLREAYRLGANSYVRKPTDSGEFSEMVLQTVMYWLLLNEIPPLDT